MVLCDDAQTALHLLSDSYRHPLGKPHLMTFGCGEGFLAMQSAHEAVPQPRLRWSQGEALRPRCERRRGASTRSVCCRIRRND
jgi:hypothetical protein